MKEHIPEGVFVGLAAFAAYLEANANSLPVPPWAALLIVGVAGAVGMGLRFRQTAPKDK